MIGSGKTAIGARLAEKLGRRFFDLDREMDRELGYSFHHLVEEKGWLAFRELEYDIIRRLAGESDIVFALGGGSIRYAWNRDALCEKGIVILLEADLRVLADRVRGADRPRVNSGVSLEEDLRRIWTSSSDVYRRAADIRYSTDKGKPVSAEVDELLTILRSYGIG